MKPVGSCPPNVTLDGYLYGSFPKTNADIYLEIFPAIYSCSVYDCIVPEDNVPIPITPEIASKFIASVMMKN